ncbi:hypothetical protein HY991_06240 [Candidatus Micrarchaeota archaeon]|nr:hypothetical protein [Candidatus Micrarchaeota archaeon]
MKKTAFVILFALAVWAGAYVYSDYIPHLYCEYKNHFVADSFYYYIAAVNYATGKDFASLCKSERPYYSQTMCHGENPKVDFYEICPDWVRYFLPRFGYYVPSAFLLGVFGSPHALIVLPFLGFLGSVILFYLLSRELNASHPVLSTAVFSTLPTVLYSAVHYIPDIVGLFFVLAIVLCAVRIVKGDGRKRLYAFIILSSVLYTTVREAPLVVLATVFLFSLMNKQKALKVLSVLLAACTAALMFLIEIFLHAKVVFTAFFLGLGLRVGTPLETVALEFIKRHTVTPFVTFFRIMTNEFGLLLLFLGAGIAVWRGERIQRTLCASIFAIQLIWIFVHPYEDFRFFFLLLIPFCMWTSDGIYYFIDKTVSRRRT